MVYIYLLYSIEYGLTHLTKGYHMFNFNQTAISGAMAPSYSAPATPALVVTNSETNSAIYEAAPVVSEAVVLSESVAPAVIGEAVTGAYRTAATSKGSVDGRVSSQWASRPDDQKFLSLTDLHAHTLARSRISTTSLVKPELIRVSADDAANGLTLELGDNEPAVNMTHYSFGQLSSLVKAPAEYMRRLPATIAAINLQHGLMEYSQDAMQAYTAHNGEHTLRAMTGKGYGRIHDHVVIEQVMKIAGDGTGQTNWKIPGVIDWSSHKDGTVLYNPFVDITKENTTLFASDRDVYIFLVDDTHPIEVGKLPNGEPDLMFRGFIVWNSETGAKSLGMAAMMMRGVCQNRNIWGVEGTKELRIRHSKAAPQRFAYEAAPLLTQYTNASTAGVIAKVHNAKAAIVAKTDEEATEFLMDRVGLNKTMSERVIETVLREEQAPARSVWDMVQGITAVARGIRHQDARLSMEMSAGKLMDKISANA